MKGTMDFSLEQAPWPALLVDGGSAICCANPAAVATFGPVVAGEHPLLAGVWSPQNDLPAEQFLARFDRSANLPLLLKFQVKGGVMAVYRTFVCPWHHNGQKYFLLQLWPESPVLGNGAEAPAGAGGATASGGAVTQKQKLDCALQLIRTVVLDFNNALTSILGHTSLLLGKMEPNHPWRSSLVEVEKSAEKAAEIAHDLAGFSRQERDTKNLVAGNLNDLLRRTVEMFPVPATAHIEWDWALERQLHAVHFDEAKLQQAFLKILDNALQAVGKHGRLGLCTRNLDLHAPLQDGSATVKPGSYVSVEISDNGCGMSREVLPRIFEPFFTTKPNHRGLGLAWVYGIVTNHGGGVAVESAPGRGTSVRIYLPALKRVVKDQSFKPEELSGTETVLIVDDEALMLTMGQMVLSAFGYKVFTADEGAKGLEIFTREKGKIDLVITDLVMPKMSGREFVERLRQMAPEVRVLCCSGYVRATSGEEDGMYLQKPFTSQGLLRKVRQALA